jgi:hypothetical protein
MTHHIAALGSVGGLGEQCGASDRGQKQLEIFQSVFENSNARAPFVWVVLRKRVVMMPPAALDLPVIVLSR